MYVCICNAVTDNQIRRARDAGIGGLHELGEHLGVGTNCGSCVELALAILQEAPAKEHPRPRLYVPNAA